MREVSFFGAGFGKVLLDKHEVMVYTMIMQNVAPKIIRVLIERGVTKREISRFCGCDYKTVYAWMYGWWKPELENLNRLRVLYIKTTMEHESQLMLPLEEST